MKKLREGIDFIFRSNSMQDSLGRKAQHDSPGSERIFYRAVWSEQEPWLRELRSSASYHQIVAQGMLEDEVPDPDLSIDGYGVVLRQRKVPFFLKPWKIPLERRITMASSWVEINMLLAKDGFGLRDAHLGNWAFSNRQEPIWVDVGSIVRLTTGREGFEEFRSWHTRPLELVSRNPSGTGDYLSDLISRDRHVKLKFPILDRLSLPFLPFPLHDDVGMKALARVLPAVAARFGLVYRKMILRAWLHRIKKWGETPVARCYPCEVLQPGNGSPPGGATWSGIPQPLSDDWGGLVSEIVVQSHAKSITKMGVTDWWHVGCALGPDSTLWVLDSDHRALSGFTAELGSAPLDPSTRVCGAVDSFMETDVRSDLVIAVGWLNRLLQEGLGLDLIAQRLSELGREEVLVDFNPQIMGVRGHSGDREGPNDPSYSVEECVAQLTEYFPHIDTFPSKQHNSQSILIHGRRTSAA